MTALRWRGGDVKHFVLFCFNDLIDFYGGPSIDLLVRYSFVSNSRDKRGDIRRCFTQKKNPNCKIGTTETFIFWNCYPERRTQPLKPQVSKKKILKNQIQNSSTVLIVNVSSYCLQRFYFEPQQINFSTLQSLETSWGGGRSALRNLQPASSTPTCRNLAHKCQ